MPWGAKNVYYIKMQTDEANQNPKYFAHNTPNECVFVCCERTQMRIICRSHSFEQANEKCEKKHFIFFSRNPSARIIFEREHNANVVWIMHIMWIIFFKMRKNERRERFRNKRAEQSSIFRIEMWHGTFYLQISQINVYIGKYKSWTEYGCRKKDAWWCHLVEWIDIRSEFSHVLKKELSSLLKIRGFRL